jgi:hypothetical protein
VATIVDAESLYWQRAMLVKDELVHDVYCYSLTCRRRGGFPGVSDLWKQGQHAIRQRRRKSFLAGA